MDSAPPEMEPGRPRWCETQRNPFIAVTLIVAGILLFLVNIGLLPIHNVWAYWPVFMIVSGLWNLTAYAWAGQRILGLLLVIFGALFLAGNLGLFSIHTKDNTWMVAAIFLVLGITRLGRLHNGPAAPWVRRRRPRFNDEQFASDLEQQIKERSAGYLDPTKIFDSAVLGSIERRVDIDGFSGGVINSVLGSVDLDLRRSVPSQNTLHVEANCVLGSVKLRIPDSWRLHVRGTPVLGSYEDKTIPQARNDAYTVNFFLTGTTILGSVEIEN